MLALTTFQKHSYSLDFELRSKKNTTLLKEIIKSTIFKTLYQGSRKSMGVHTKLNKV